MNPHADVSYPLSIVMSRQWRQYGKWRLPHWELVALLPQPGASESATVSYRRVQTEHGDEHFVWSGLWLDLFRDGLQSYYQNLIGKQPSLFVLCRDDDVETGMAPVTISANFADAEAHMETDGVVLSTPLVAPFSNRLAEYILKNQSVLNQQMQDYKSGKKGKRRHV